MRPFVLLVWMLLITASCGSRAFELNAEEKYWVSTQKTITVGVQRDRSRPLRLREQQR